MFHLINFQLPLIFSLLIVLVAAKILGEVAERFGQPSMIGEVLAGVILGPSLLNVIQNTAELKVLAELGVFLLIVMAGLEIEVEDIRNSIRGKNIWIALLGFVIPFIGGTLTGYVFHFNKTFLIGLGLNARGIMELVIANIALQRGFIDVSVFSILVIMALLTTIITPFFLQTGFNVIEWNSSRGPRILSS